MAKYKLVVWDVDGTLLDTSPGLISSTRFMIDSLGLPEISDEVLKSFVGPRIQDSLKRVYGLTGEELSNAATVFRNHYKEGDVLKAALYPGISELLVCLHDAGIKMAVATNKRQDFTDSLMAEFGFDRYLDCVFGTDPAGKYVKTDLINMCIDFFPGIAKSDAVMIGDSAYDAEAAREAGVNFIGVTYGFDFESREDMNEYNPKGAAGDIKELKELLLMK